MAAKLEKLEGNKAKLEIAVSPEKFEEGISKAYQKLKGKFNVPGFRKGKVPRKIVENYYGPQVFYEDALDNGYGQSCRGYYLLTWLGYPKVKVLNGGFSAWKAAGLPVSTTPVTPVPATFPTDLQSADVMLTRADVEQALGTDVVLLDVRDVDEWIGESSSPYGKDFAPRKGRLPGARWIEWYRFMKPSANGPVFKSPDEIRAECASAGVKPDDTVYLYCFKGARASNTFLALKQAGFDDVRMYFGSWNEWSRDPSLPIESGPPFAMAA